MLKEPYFFHMLDLYIIRMGDILDHLCTHSSDGENIGRMKLYNGKILTLTLLGVSCSNIHQK